MSPLRHCLALLSSLLLAAVLALVAPAQAQQPDAFQVVVPHDVLSLPGGSLDFPTMADAIGGQLTAYADGVECISADVSGATEDVVLILGLPGQPDACGTDGATVNFIDGRGRTLATWFTLEKGTARTLDNFAPVPPCQGDCPFPGPRTSPPPPGIAPVACPPNRPVEAPAMTLVAGSISVTVPRGRFAVLGESPPGSGSFVICYEANAGIRLSTSDCTELVRYASTPQENAILDQIAASCSVATPTATEATQVPSKVRPPVTGSAGLKR